MSIIHDIKINVHAQIDTVWNLLLDRMENPAKYQPRIQGSRIVERMKNGVIREIRERDAVIREKITLDRAENLIHSELLQHPIYSGAIETRMLPTSAQNPMSPVTVEIRLRLELKDDHVKGTIRPDANIETDLKEELDNFRKKAEEMEG